MKIRFSNFFIALAAVALLGSPAWAQSAKYAAADNEMSVCSVATSGLTSPLSSSYTIPGLNCTAYSVTNSSGTSTTATMDGPNWVVINTLNIHTSNSQSLLVTPSLVTGLYTETKSGGSTSSASAKVLLRVVDVTGCSLSSSAVCSTEVPAEPVIDCTSSIFGCTADGVTSNNKSVWGVAFDERVQTLKAKLSSGNYVDLALATADGHSFGFGFDDVSSGTHEIAIEAAVETDASTDAISNAAFGLGFTTVEAVQFTQGSNDLNF